MTTIMQPFHCDLQPQIQNTNRSTHTGTTTHCRTQRRNIFASETTLAAPAAHTRYLSSPAATTLHGKMQGFVLRLPPQHKPHATFMQPLQSLHFPKSPLPFVTSSLRHHFPSSPLPFLTTSLRHHFPYSCDVKSHTTLCHSLLFFCDVLLCDAKDTHTHTPPFINVMSHHPSSMSSLTILFVRNMEVLLPNFL